MWNCWEVLSNLIHFSTLCLQLPYKFKAWTQKNDYYEVHGMMWDFSSYLKDLTKKWLINAAILWYNFLQIIKL